MENNANYKSGFVALIGPSERGKIHADESTFLIGQKIAITSEGRRPPATAEGPDRFMTCDEGQTVLRHTGYPQGEK